MNSKSKGCQMTFELYSVCFQWAPNEWWYFVFQSDSIGLWVNNTTWEHRLKAGSYYRNLGSGGEIGLYIISARWTIIETSDEETLSSGELSRSCLITYYFNNNCWNSLHLSLSVFNFNQVLFGKTEIWHHLYNHGRFTKVLWNHYKSIYVMFITGYRQLLNIMFYLLC